MAESKCSRNEYNGTGSIESGSEFVFEHICQPCSTENVFEAAGFCIDCQEWLCEECYKYHRRPSPMRNHQLMDIEQMRTNMPSASGKDKCTQTCDQHEGKKLKYFCSIHDCVGCSMCIFQNHRGCSVDSIPELAKDIFNQAEFTSLMDRFKDVSSTAKEIKNDAKRHIVQVPKKHSETIETIETFRKELNDVLYEIENGLKTKCSIQKEAEIKKLETITKYCQTMHTQSHALTSKLDALKTRNQSCDAFVVMKQAGAKIKPLEDKVQEARISATTSNYTFKANRELLQTLRSTGTGGFGTLTDDGEYDDSYYSNLKAEYVKDIPLGNSSRISGSALLSPNKLVVADFSNKQVKVMDTDKDRLISEFKVKGEPWSVATIDDTAIAVTVHNKEMVLVLRLMASGDLSEEKRIEVDGQCHGIVFDDNKFILTFRFPDKIELVDMEGSVLRTLASSGDWPSGILSAPQHVILSPDKQSIYVSNFDDHTVVCLRLDGTVVAKYHDDELRSPEQAVVDENGIIFISTWSSSNVHLITPNCKKVKVLLTEADGLKGVMSISYCGRRQRLYLGMDNCDKIKVFQLK